MTAGTDRDFALDRFQTEAIAHLDAGRSVLVAAPTGAGKTVVAEHAIDAALKRGRRAFYTAPIKALSNQKYRDLAGSLGGPRVGLLTGDNAINGDAAVVVMTTEVLRNMLYEGRELEDLDVVVLDEVHYLEDSYRGPVWEEVILHLPAHVKLVCLSATVSNTDEVGGWLESVRGPTAVVVETERPVALTNLFAVGDRRGDRLHLVPTLVDARANPDGARYDVEPRVRRGARRHRPRSPWRAPSRLELLDELEDRDLLPVIWFVFSRKGCDRAARSLVEAGVRFTTPSQAQTIRDIAETHLSQLTAADRAVLDTDAWLGAIQRGVGAHHAGLVPAYKEAIESCFAAGLIRVVFATETLALGVNLPARSVVIDKLTKFTGESHELLTAGQFTQLTGRAGRRGIDDHGTAVVPWSPYTPFDQVAALAASRSFKLRSAFRPTYNMAANLLARLGPGDAREILGRSFAQYQADVGVARLEQRIAVLRRRVDELATVAGSEAIEDSTTPTAEEIAEAVSRLRPGDVVLDTRGDRLAVTGVSWRRGGKARVRLVDTAGRAVRWDLSELTDPPHTVGRIELPGPLAPDRADFRSDVAGRLRRARFKAGRPTRSRRRTDPAEQLRRARSELSSLERKARSADTSLARQFDAIVEVMRARGHLDGWDLTDRGAITARIYHEADLLIAEALTDGLLDDLRPPALASVVSCFTHEHRSPSPPPEPWYPDAQAGRRAGSIDATARALRAVERHHGVSETRSLEGGFAHLAHAWAAGEELAQLLDDELSAGDFVRNVKQLVDLLRQISMVAPVQSTRRAAASAADSLTRGVVALSGAVEAQ